MNSRVRRLLDAYPAIFLACHREHVREDGGGRRLSEHRASVLDHLDASRPMTLSKLAEHMGVGRSAMSITVSRLVRDGYIARSRVAADRRSVGLTLTTRGARVKEQNAVLDHALVERMFAPMRPAELESALAGLELLATYAKALLRERKRGRDR